MQIKPIRTPADYEAALQEVDQLMDARPNTPAGDKLDVWVTLIEAYEAEHFPIPEPHDPVGVLQYTMESRGVSRSDLIPLLGSKERVSEIFNGKRGLSLAMIRRLHEALGIPADLLIAASRPGTRKSAKPVLYSTTVNPRQSQVRGTFRSPAHLTPR